MLSDKVRLLAEKLVESHSPLLAPLSWLYALAVFIRNFFYDANILPVTKVSCTVVSVGNIIAGGTGKTPLIHLLASSFPHRKVAILSRGYGSIPDEAILLSKRLPKVKVFVGKNRVKLAQIAAQEADLILLDDGFQYRKLFRDFEIVLHEKSERHYLPWGFLRDSPKRLKTIELLFDETDFEMRVEAILDLKGRSIDSIQGKNGVLFSAIANPKRFKKTVEGLGVKITGEKRFADHAQIDLNALPKADLFICTEKDAVKLPPTPLPIVYLKMQMVMNKGLMEFKKGVEKIDRKIENG